MTGAAKYAYASALAIGFGDDAEDGAQPETVSTPKVEPLPKARVELIGGLITKTHALPVDEIAMLFGEVGANPPASAKPVDLRRALHALTPSQADAMETALEAREAPDQEPTE
jgi:hypothetical protein